MFMKKVEENNSELSKFMRNQYTRKSLERERDMNNRSLKSLKYLKGTVSFK